MQQEKVLDSRLEEERQEARTKQLTVSKCKKEKGTYNTFQCGKQKASTITKRKLLTNLLKRPIYMHRVCV